MLHRHRRLLFPLAALLLAVPLLATLALPAAPAISAEEARPLASLPALPRRPAEWPRFLRAADAWLSDHFGLRRPMLRAYAMLVHLGLDTGDDQVWIGRGEHLYYRGNAMLEQSAGLLRRPLAVARTADMLATMRAVLAARGARLLVAPPPNAATIAVGDLPDWARNPGRPTEYDLFLAALAARGVAAVDLRPVLRAAGEGAYFRHDSHWSLRGALAGMDAIVAAAGLPQWQQTPQEALGPPVMLVGGDLARMLGIAPYVREQVEPLRRWSDARELLGDAEAGPYAVATDGPGPRVLVIGDSFTDAVLAPMLRGRAGRFFWMHHRACGFDWRWVERLRPDQVWYMPTERFLACPDRGAPAGLAAAAAALGLRAGRDVAATALP